ncbi:flagellar hook-associated protein FlgK [Catonella morbi ATCC 51271]|uniref:Flagellar hook-associated protein 1 n=1 Tax=Catonella morbi ATCC 51271 TaxID=592026 RepID=V2Z3V5_9FIRM|nr:flagellar hook-associated protein FlgK [Catonella morbi]ESL01590.1 flagellar hook-associated protein FlgK [Catonella morbi ATCC 51271]
MGLMTSFGVGVSGLNAAQNSLNATAHNITNADTKGYVRQQVLTVDKEYAKTATVRGMDQTGHGTIIDKIRQLRDRFLDAAYRKESGRHGFYQAQAEAITEVENLFGELEGTTFQSSMEGLWKAVQELQKEPESKVARTALVETANTFIERCQSISTQLKSFSQDLNLKVKNTVDRINTIGKRIDELNTLIRKEEAGEQEANDYRDERNKLLDELGGYVKMSYKEVRDGTILVTVEGTQFVTEFGVNEIGLKTTDDGLNLHTPVWNFDTNDDGEPREVFNFSVPPTAAADTDIGSLKGLLLSRGTQGRYTDIPVQPKPEDYENGEEDEYYISAMRAFEEAKTNYNNRTAPSLLTNTEAQFDQLIHGLTTMINDVLAPNLTATWTDGGTPIWRNSEGKILEGDEIPPIDIDDLDEYKIEEKDALGKPTGRYKVSILDTKNAPVSSDSSKTPGNALFERKSRPRYKELDLEMDGKKVMLYNSEDYDPNNEDSKYSMYSMGELEVNKNIRENVSLIPLSYNTNTGDYSMDTAAKLNKIWDKKFAVLNPNTLTKNDIMEYYTSFTSEIANTGHTRKALAKSQDVTKTSVDNQRQQVLGVSSDEELTHMIKFQQAFNAASRYITVIDEMLEHVVTRLGS